MKPYDHATSSGTNTKGFAVRSMLADDYPQVAELWSRTGCRTRPGRDDLAAIALFLSQNPDLCTVAEWDDRIIGALLCGEDGRAGYIHRVAVDSDADRVEVTSLMVRRFLLKLRALGVDRCYLLCDTGCLSVEIGRSASSGLSEAVETLADEAMQIAARMPEDTSGEPGLSCEIIKPRKQN